MAQTALPYLTEDQIRKNYANQLSEYDAQRKAEAERATAAANQQYNNMQRSNYVDYRMAQRDLPQQLARQGITGGASETSLLRGQTNYENNRNATELQRGNRLGEINNAYLDALATYRMTADQQMNDAIAQNRQLEYEYQERQKELERQQQREKEERFANNIAGYRTEESIDAAIEAANKNGETWKIPYLRQQKTVILQQKEAKAQAKQERREERFANTISGYDSIKGIDKKIAAIRKSGKDTWRIPYLRARRAELVAAQKESSSGGGYSSGGYSSGGGGGGQDDVVYEYETPQAQTSTNGFVSGAVAGAIGASGKSGKSGKPKNNNNNQKSSKIRSAYSLAGRTGNYLGGHTQKPGSAGSYQTSHRTNRRRYTK